MYEKMTIYYKKRTGDIIQIMTDAHDMNVFSDNKEDMELIYDYIIIQYDDTIIRNANLFYVDLETKQVKLKSELIQNYL